MKVTDGDTIQVMHENKTEKIRLHGIDCPESNQDFGNLATQFTSDLSFAKKVTVIVHDIDKYGRTVGEVILPDDRSLNRELVRAGLAWWYQKYSNDLSLGELEREAREAKKGLWINAKPIAPWDFRKAMRSGRSKTEILTERLIPQNLLPVSLSELLQIPNLDSKQSNTNPLSERITIGE